MDSFEKLEKKYKKLTTEELFNETMSAFKIWDSDSSEDERAGAMHILGCINREAEARERKFASKDEDLWHLFHILRRSKQPQETLRYQRDAKNSLQQYAIYRLINADFDSTDFKILILLYDSIAIPKLELYDFLCSEKVIPRKYQLFKKRIDKLITGKMLKIEKTRIKKEPKPDPYRVKEDKRRKKKLQVMGASSQCLVLRGDFIEKEFGIPIETLIGALRLATNEGGALDKYLEWIDSMPLALQIQKKIAKDGVVPINEKAIDIDKIPDWAKPPEFPKKKKKN